MDDFAACAELCEQHGFDGPAAALRAIGQGLGRFYLVRATENAVNLGLDIGPPDRKVFLDPASAERYARAWTARALRSFTEHESYDRNPSGLSDEDYCREVGSILGADYEFPEDDLAPAFPESATDEQMWRISQLLDFSPLFEVALIEEEAAPVNAARTNRVAGTLPADFAACADLCEASGFDGPAAVLRAIGEDRCRFFAVRGLGSPEWIDYYGWTVEDIAPSDRKVFLDPAAADRHARRLTGRALRKCAPFETWGLRGGDFCRVVGEVLGVPFQLPERDGLRTFPGWATDDQLWEISWAVNFAVFEVVAIGPPRPAGRPYRGEGRFPAWSNASPPPIESTPIPAGALAMDDFLACSDLCEENRFPRQAAILRAMAGAGGKVYVVAERDVDYNDENLYFHDTDGHPRSLFFASAEAEHAAEARNVERLRGLPLLEYGINLDDFTSMPTESELNRRVGAILGIDFDLWSYDESECPFPPEATDEQMAEVARLFDKLRFYHVIEAEFGG